MEGCKFCKRTAVMLGKDMFIPFMYKNCNKVFYKDIKPLTKGLDIKIVGGLINHGRTSHDIDVVGNKKAIVTFQKRLLKRGIKNPIHYCGVRKVHSNFMEHIECIVNGVKIFFTGKGY